MSRIMGIVAALAGLAVGTAALAAPPGPRDPDWPCVQIKVPDLSLAAIWSGPPIDPYAQTWSQDPEVAAMAARLAQRRLPLEQAQAQIAAFAQGAGAEKRARLLALLAGLFDTLDRERGSVIAGLDRFGQRQKELAGQTRTDLDALHALQAAPNPDPKRLTALGERLGWETKLLEDRRESVTYACEVPDAIEHRLFALARTIQQNLD